MPPTLFSCFEIMRYPHLRTSGNDHACPWAELATACPYRARWSGPLAPSTLRCTPSSLLCGICADPSSSHSSPQPTAAMTGICATTPSGRHAEGTMGMRACDFPLAMSHRKSVALLRFSTWGLSAQMHKVRPKPHPWFRRGYRRSAGRLGERSVDDPMIVRDATYKQVQN
jgi:hypothetical protein